jgi:hypothetical protein
LVRDRRDANFSSIDAFFASLVGKVLQPQVWISNSPEEAESARLV